jgi:cellulose synthase/poly-beta-1,6-N-acetylglucosamine synthase-like glycosyltransferase
MKMNADYGLFNSLQLFVILYFFWLNGIYVMQLVVSLYTMIKRYEKTHSGHMEFLTQSDDLPSISFIVPTFNESESIVFIVQTLLNLNYPNKKVIVVNDGSTDETLKNMKRVFHVTPIHGYYTSQIQTEPVLGCYLSLSRKDLVFVDKMNGGKADAMNAGLSVCDTDYIIMMDSDTIIDSYEFNLMIRYLLTKPSHYAAGASVRVANGCRLFLRGIREVRMPKSYLAKIQVVEYLRSFFVGRLGWEAAGGAIIISGAFALFHTKHMVSLGGFRTKTLAEDMDITVRFKKQAYENGESHKTEFLPEAVAWTEVPEKLRELGAQRTRWHMGLAEILYRYRSMILNPRYGTTGMLIMPYFLFGELLAPIVEVLGYLLIGYTLIWGESQVWILFFILASSGFTIMMNFASILLETLYIRKYDKLSDVLMMLLFSLLENIGYRQLMIWWRLKGLYRFLRGDIKWNVIAKEGFKID